MIGHTKRLKRLNATGDTIVEVLIVLAILSFAFATASVTANKGLGQSRNAQEHSQALGIVSAQMELARKAVSGSTAAVLPTSGQFCMNGTTPDPVLANCAVATSSGYSYSPVATYVDDGGGSGHYEFRVTWPGAGDLGDQQELMTYRLYPLVHSATSGITIGDTKAKVSVEVSVIPPTPGTGEDAGGFTPPCTDPATQGINGAKVTLDHIDDGLVDEVGTTVSGAYAFLGLKDNYNFKTLLDEGSYSSRFKLCPAQTPAQSPTYKVGVAHDGSPVVRYKLQPQCVRVDEPSTTSVSYGPPSRWQANPDTWVPETWVRSPGPGPGAIAGDGKWPSGTGSPVYADFRFAGYGWYRWDYSGGNNWYYRYQYVPGYFVPTPPTYLGETAYYTTIPHHRQDCPTVP